MKRLFLGFLAAICMVALTAQTRLNVEGDAFLSGRLTFVNGSVYIGNDAGNLNTNNSTGVFIGTDAGGNNSAFFNTFVGAGSGQDNASGFSNSFIGYQSGNKNVSGSWNVFVGRNAGFGNEGGNYNVYMGELAGTGRANGNFNVGIGASAGNGFSKGSRNTFLGYDADVLFGPDSLDRAIAIGHRAYVGCNNCAVIGGTGAEAVNYEGLVPVLIEGVKEQQTQIADLVSTVEQQQAQIESLTKLVERLLEQETGEDPGSADLQLPDTGGLGQNYPNPFHQNTIIDYRLPMNARKAFLQVSGTDGKVISRIAVDKMEAGQLTIRAGSYPAGTYFYSLVVDGQILDTKKMVLTR